MVYGEVLCTAWSRVAGGVTSLNCEVPWLDGIEWSVSRPSRLTVQEDSPVYPTGFQTAVLVAQPLPVDSSGRHVRPFYSCSIVLCACLSFMVIPRRCLYCFFLFNFPQLVSVSFVTGSQACRCSTLFPQNICILKSACKIATLILLPKYSSRSRKRLTAKKPSGRV